MRVCIIRATGRLLESQSGDGDLKALFTNAMAARSRRPLRRDTMAALLAHYGAHHAEGGKLLAQFDTLYLTGWSPHDSQQKPLAPGSAKARLAEALGTPEHVIKSK